MVDLVAVASSLDISQLPMARPPPGVKSNFVNPPSWAPPARAIVYTTWALMLVFFLLRLYTRARITRSLGADDYLCMITVAFVTAESGMLLSILGPKVGPHVWDVPAIQYSTTLLVQLVFMSFYLVCAVFLKSSVILFLIRIFRPKKSAVITLWVSLAIIAVVNIVLLIVGNTICNLKDVSLFKADGSTLAQIIQASNITQEAEQPGANVTALMYTAIETWIETQIDGKCGSSQIISTSTQGFFTAVTDFYILGLSIWLTLGLRLSPRRKVAVCAVFLVGLLACACSVIGAYSRITRLHTIDVTYYSAITFSLGVAEHNIGIISASMPVAPVLYKRLTNSSTWSYLSSLITSRKPVNTSNPSFPENSPSNSKVRRMNLVQIPKATLTGLRSFMGMRSTRTQVPRMTEASAYIEIGSVNEEYHMYMREGGSKGQHTPQTDTWNHRPT
ncbi:hypothetical protein F4805DRAFT_459863 [Annulohypoxylon moriforme]|nr:hypothetical protein F4805DRAFT_459863 [Annulohypoxylon moriforme]